MTPEPFQVPLKPVEAELMVANSLFIASLAPAKTLVTAREFQKAIQQRFQDATHHVPAFIIGHGKSVITHSSDDGEPSGTAGRPALEVLQGSGLGNVAVVVTRYFGGTKLGTGGLVRAYGDAVRSVLKIVKRGRLIPTTTYKLVVAYPLYDQIERLTRNYAAEILEARFEADITLLVRVKDDKSLDFIGKLVSLSAGRIHPEIFQRDPETIFPL